MPGEPRLRIAVLGPLEVTREGTRVEPTSPKVRTLLLDLVIHRGETMGRDRLIDDLWGEQPPATAPGVLQNYLSQLRRALGADVVRTIGKGYALATELVVVDAVDFEAHLDRARAARSRGDADAVLKATADALLLWRGEPLADVAFEAFARPELTRLHELRALARELQLEAEIGGGRHQDAIAPLESAVAEHPLRERLWWLLMLALYRSGRQADALRAYQRARGVLAGELGLEPSVALRELEQAILEQRADVANLLTYTPQRRLRRRTNPSSSLLGRADEWAAIDAFLEHRHRTSNGLLLVLGEAGIGKTRLLEEAQVRMEACGALVVSGRAFEAERGRSYGVWVDALRATALPALDASLRAGLGPLLPELSDDAPKLDDVNRLYDAVVQVLDMLSAHAPVVVLIDDVQWLDEPSVALLHFAIRHLADSDVSFLAAARPGELDENLPAARVMQSLRRDQALSELALGPLAPASISELTQRIAPGADAQQIADATNGNPLYALEMALALARGDEPLSSRLDALIGDRLARLGQRGAALVPWIAAFGRGVPPTVLVQFVEQDATEVFERLGDLERHGVVLADADGNVQFVHDLVRTAAYKRLSTPRRSTLHARIAAVLASTADPDDSLAAETARHADAGHDSGICAQACVRAARRCLRLLAYRDAEVLVGLGRLHAKHLPPPERVKTEFELIRVLLHPGVRLRDAGALTRDLTELCAEAQRLELDAELPGGLSLLARAYHWGWGDIPRARIVLERAVRLIEDGREPNLEPLLEAARCLAYLEMDMDRTARLFDELGALHTLTAASLQYQWGLGLVQAWRGDIDSARAGLAQAIDLAVARADHWVTFECMARLALLELEAGGIDAAAAICVQLTALAERLGHGSERPYAAAIAALQALACRDAGADAALDAAVSRLEGIDARFLVPDLLGIAAELHQRAGEAERARARAERALEVAEGVARPFEAARAHAILACLAADAGQAFVARRHLDDVVRSSGSLPGHVEALRRQAERLIEARLPG